MTIGCKFHHLVICTKNHIDLYCVFNNIAFLQHFSYHSYDVDQSLQRQSYLEKKQLIIYRGFHKVKKRIHSLKEHFHSGHQLHWHRKSHEGEEVCENTRVENITSNLDNTLESAKAS